MLAAPPIPLLEPLIPVSFGVDVNVDWFSIVPDVAVRMRHGSPQIQLPGYEDNGYGMCLAYVMSCTFIGCRVLSIQKEADSDAPRWKRNSHACIRILSLPHSASKLASRTKGTVSLDDAPDCVQILPRFVPCLCTGCEMSYHRGLQHGPTRLSTAYIECEKVNFTDKSFINTRSGLFSEQRPGTSMAIGESSVHGRP